HHAVTLNYPHTGPLQQRPDAAGKLSNNPLLPGVETRHVQRWCGCNDTQVRGLAALSQTVEFISGVYQRLGGNAPNIEAGAARNRALHEHGIQARLGRTDRGHITPWAASQNQYVRRLHVDHSTKRSEGHPSRPRMQWMKSAACMPSTTRRSKEDDNFIILRTTTAPFSTTGRSTPRFTPTMATPG